MQTKKDVHSVIVPAPCALRTASASNAWTDTSGLQVVQDAGLAARNAQAPTTAKSALMATI